MPIQIHAPDGSVAEFPDGTDDATITSVMRKTYGGPQPIRANPPAGRQVAPGKPSLFDKAAAYSMAATEQIPFLDEAVAATAAGLTGSSYDEMRQRQSGFAARDDAALPGYRNAGGISGFGATVVAPMGGAKWISGAPSLAQAAGRSAAIGAAVGGVSGAASADGGMGDRVEGGAKGAAFGGALGAAVGPLARAAQAGGSRVVKAAAPVLAKVEAAKKAAYDAVDQAGVQYTPQAMTNLVGDIENTLKGMTINPKLHPQAAEMLKYLRTQAKTSPTITQLDQLRQIVDRDVTRAGGDTNKMFGRAITDKINGFIESALPTDVSAGDPRVASAAITAAKQANRAWRKLQAVDGAVEKAKNRVGGTGSGGNIDNATRQNLRAVMEKTPGLTAEEQTAFQKAVRGSAIQNTMRAVGKTSPLNGGLMGLGNTVAAGMNPALWPVALATSAAKVGADSITAANVQTLRRVIAAGGPASAAATKIVKANPALAKAVASAGIAIDAAGGRQTAPRPTVSAHLASDPSVAGYAYGPAGR